ncbi:hypothetical protein DFA_06378 [Cavenderia fasciculata]|uniref:Uncharacterized protein n=1 Tax=Cavenderia fasciculata TaxID=261658 RepID=F4PKV6_CACFS|nr:uncharacterized protein DFA_06378 [Cavenderia fasciculata]EGG24230.1 hypothetical protein DFA_06378 [Cavenderia fasciculata]|eukprot:XP_004362081.1 hypothetical protein DFA_06378 [Cavenderia fasciculata]
MHIIFSSSIYTDNLSKLSSISSHSIQSEVIQSYSGVSSGYVNSITCGGGCGGSGGGFGGSGGGGGGRPRHEGGGGGGGHNAGMESGRN